MMFNFKKTILYLALLAAICIICFRSVSQSSKPKEPKYRYFLRHETEIDEYVPAIDTVNFVLQQMGKSMTVDQADQYRNLVTRNMQRLVGKVTRDSVIIK